MKKVWSIVQNEWEVSDNINHEWQSFLWTQAKRSISGLADARFDGQLVLEDITIISVVSCTTVLMV